jgi:hypothetical protein
LKFDPPRAARGPWSYDGLLPGLTLQELRSYYDAQSADSVDEVVAHLVAALRHIHEQAHEMEAFVAAAKRGAEAATNAR